MKVVDIERVVILMRFIQYGWDEERKKSFDDNLRMMLETQCEDLEEHDKQIRADVIEEYRLALHKKHADNKYLYESNKEHWNLDMGEVDEIAGQLKGAE